MEHAEELIFDKDFGMLMLDALKKSLKKNRRQNVTIKWEEMGDMMRFTIKPTLISILYDWFFYAGEMYSDEFVRSKYIKQ